MKIRNLPSDIPEIKLEIDKDLSIKGFVTVFGKINNDSSIDIYSIIIHIKFCEELK